MTQLGNHRSYVLISPVKDEERYVETTIQSIIRQTVKPARWIFVDDGSRDQTPEIIRGYAAHHDWIQVMRIERGTDRQPGSAVIRAFSLGYDAVAAQEFDFVVKLDCDLDLPPDYFENLLMKFQEDPSLGIASGVYWEQYGGPWVPVKMPAHHAAGAAKMMRRQCYEEIGGFVSQRGWDTVDEIRALNKGWTTRHFEELAFRHLKTEGAGIGNLRTNLMHGEVYYLTGGGAFFLFLKFLHRLVTGKPRIVGGLAMLWGYLKPWLSGRPRLVDEREARLYRRLLNDRIRKGALQAFAKSKEGNPVRVMNC